MRFGCTTAETGRLSQLAEMGFDFAELRCRALAPLRDDITFASIVDRVRESGIPVETLSGVIPPYVGLKVVGPGVERAKLLGHVEMVLDRGASIGARLAVFGGGGARTVPPGFPRDRALAQLRDFLGAVGELCAARKMTLTLESLNQEETNLINTLDEAAAIVRQLNRANVLLTLDYYHCLTSGEKTPLSAAAMPLVAHVHTSDENRQPPSDARLTQETLFRSLSSARYGGRVSIEARFEDFSTEAPAALAYLRQLWATHSGSGPDARA